MVQLTWNLGLGHLEALDCGQYMKFMDQVTGSALSGAHWVRMTSYGLNDLKFECRASWGSRLWTVHEIYGPSHWKYLKWSTLGTDDFKQQHEESDSKLKKAK
jgi:hypothetical protein